MCMKWYFCAVEKSADTTRIETAKEIWRVRAVYLWAPKCVYQAVNLWAMQIYIYVFSRLYRRLCTTWTAKIIQTPDEIVFRQPPRNEIKSHAPHSHPFMYARHWIDPWRLSSEDARICEQVCSLACNAIVHETMLPNRWIERQLNVSANNLNMEIYRRRCKRQPRQAMAQRTSHSNSSRWHHVECTSMEFQWQVAKNARVKITLFE